MSNDHLVLIGGESSSGKTASLRNLPKQEGVMYCNCESGKKISFPGCGFKQAIITDPYQVHQAFDIAETKPEVHTVIIDGLNYLMDMFESMYVLNSSNTMKAWGLYAQFFKILMQEKVAKSTKNVIITAHTLTVLNEADMVLETKVPIKGSLKNTGIESFFSTVVSTKKINITALEGMESDMLNITEEEEDLGFKYVFQTRITKETVNSRIRSPMGMWSKQETFIDNDVFLLMKKLHTYYK